MLSLSLFVLLCCPVLDAEGYDSTQPASEVSVCETCSPTRSMEPVNNL